MKMCMALAIIIFVILFQGYYFQSYYTFGNNLLYDNEGDDITSVSGYKSVIDISSYECAQSCLSMRQESGCCNSFTYNTERRECYLKLKPRGSSTARSYNRDGWQTYTLDYIPGSYYLDSVQALQFEFIHGQSHSYIHKGMNLYAKNDGYSILTFDGKEFLSEVTPDDCAKACNRVSRCNSFAFKPIGNRGICYLKDNRDNSRAIKYVSEGWRTYWKDSLNKCFATCDSNNYSNNYCVICLFKNVCFER